MNARRSLRSVKLILPALTEATSPGWRPIKYSLFPPLGLATLAAYLDPDLEISLQDEHVEKLGSNDQPDLVIIQVYITNAYRAYQIADHYRARGSCVLLGGLHVTSLPDEAAQHADTIFIGPGEHTFPQFLRDLAAGVPQRRYESAVRTLEALPPIRRDLIQRHRYLVPNSIVVSRGCPTIARSATRTPSSREGARSTRSSWTTRSPRLPACPADISTSWTIISSGIPGSREISSAA